MNAPHFPSPASHDLSLPPWGPYTKTYNGIAHIADLSRGIRFDLSVFPGYYRHKVTVPHSQWESGYHPWEAAPGLSYYSYRYDLEWKDQVYCDVAFFPPSHGSPEDARLVRSEFVNNTDLAQHTVLHYMASLSFPPVRPYSEEAVIPVDVVLPPGATWVDALDYEDLSYATQRPSDSLVYEGWYRAEVRDHGFVNGTGIGCGFGAEAGDQVNYKITLPAALENGRLLIRFRATQGTPTFEINGIVHQPVEFTALNEFSLYSVPLGSVAAGEISLELVSSGSAAVELDGFVFLESAAEAQVQFLEHHWQPVPELQPGPKENSLIVHYADATDSYGIAWGGTSSVVRQFFAGELDRTLPYFGTEHVQTEIHVDDGGHFTNIFIRPVVLAPHSRTVIYGLVCCGTDDPVRQELAAFDPRSAQLEEQYARAREGRVTFSANPSGQKYIFSQERMAATMLSNVVFPVYTRRSFIRHFTPGKRWDCLYTWDSGFISLGLQSFDLDRAIDCLNAYTTPPGDPQVAFIHHGSPVPVQIYAFQELFNRTQSPELLRYFYPRLRQFYNFLAGHLGSSTTTRMQSKLLKTWDYFYNSGGWDDYPPQAYVYFNHLEATVTPVVNTAHAIRSAKILQQAARALDLPEDVQAFQTDIDTWVASLNQNAWDAQAGVFSYVVHDAEGQPLAFLRYLNGENLNLGLDGISPLFAGICTPAQERAILERMISPEHMWSPIGLISVDQTAAYYRADGYWNGAVWFPYQWFLWKSLLDLGHGDFADLIARTALDIWKQEVEATHQCFEHFIVASQRGAGWHHFGGLSSPILAWFQAYHCPGTLTCGFDTWIELLRVSPDQRSLQADLIHSGADRPWLALVVLPPEQNYSFIWNEHSIIPLQRDPGTYEISLTGSGHLSVTPGKGEN